MEEDQENEQLPQWISDIIAETKARQELKQMLDEVNAEIARKEYLMAKGIHIIPKKPWS
jgi:hypothetical protein